MLVGQADAGVDRLPGHRLAKLALGVPDLTGVEPRRQPPDLGGRRAAPRLRAEQVVEVEGLDRVVGTDAVPGGGGGEPGRLGGLVGCETPCPVGGGDERLVDGRGNDVKGFGHGLRRPW